MKDREAYVVMRDHRLLQKPRERAAELYQAARLFELLPQQPNDLWQMDVTYIHIPGHGWWYAVTVIDYYSRYLLACHLDVQLQRLHRSCTPSNWRVRKQSGSADHWRNDRFW